MQFHVRAFPRRVAGHLPGGDGAQFGTVRCYQQGLSFLVVSVFQLVEVVWFQRRLVDLVPDVASSSVSFADPCGSYADDLGFPKIDRLGIF